MIVGLVNIGIGNLHSITKFLDHKDTKYILINNEKEFEKCDKIIIPGQGAFNFSIKQIENSFLKDSIINHILKKKYILGICLGMQLFMEKSFENDISNGLGLIKGNVIKEYLKINEGPLLGRLMNYLSMELAFNRLDNFDEAIYKGKQWIQQNAPKCD